MSQALTNWTSTLSRVHILFSTSNICGNTLRGAESRLDMAPFINGLDDKAGF